MDDDIMMKMASDVGKMSGKLDEFITAQKVINDGLDKRVTATEKTRNTLIGVAMASATGGGGIAAALAKFFGVTHGGP